MSFLDNANNQNNILKTLNRNFLRALLLKETTYFAKI